MEKGMEDNGVVFEDLEKIKSGNHRAYPLKWIAWIYLSLSIISFIVLSCFSASNVIYAVYAVISLFQGLVVFYFISALTCLIENTHATNKLLNQIINNQKKDGMPTKLKNDD